MQGMRALGYFCLADPMEPFTVDPALLHGVGKTIDRAIKRSVLITEGRDFEVVSQEGV